MSAYRHTPVSTCWKNVDIMLSVEGPKQARGLQPRMSFVLRVGVRKWSGDVGRISRGQGVRKGNDSRNEGQSEDGGKDPAVQAQKSEDQEVQGNPVKTRKSILKTQKKKPFSFRG